MYLIPHHAFMGLYEGVLRLLQSEGHITDSNRRLLVALSKALEQDSENFPSQNDLGLQIGVSMQQVGNIIRTLKKKRLIQVIPPGNSARNDYKKRNSYRFLYHEMYKPFMSMDNRTLKNAIKDHFWSAGEPFPDYLDEEPYGPDIL